MSLILIKTACLWSSLIGYNLNYNYRVDFLGVDVLGVDILGVDILGRTLQACQQCFGRVTSQAALGTLKIVMHPTLSCVVPHPPMLVVGWKVPAGCPLEFAL